MKMHVTWASILLLFIFAFNSAILAQNARKDAQKNANLGKIGTRDINKGDISFSSIEKEEALGRQISLEMEKHVTLVEDAEVQNYIQRLADRIAQHSDVKFPLRIKVVRSDNFNGFALPGGYLYINTGLIQASGNEAELAYAIAQLSGFVASRAFTENKSKGSLLQIASIPALVWTGGVAGTALANSPAPAVPIGLFRFSKQAVKEADYLGLQYLFVSGYDPAAAVSLLQKLQAQESGKKPTLFDTHPATAERIAKIQEGIEKILPSRAQNVLDSSEFHDMKARLK